MLLSHEAGEIQGFWEGLFSALFNGGLTTFANFWVVFWVFSKDFWWGSKVLDNFKGLGEFWKDLGRFFKGFVFIRVDKLSILENPSFLGSWFLLVLDFEIFIAH